MKFEKNDFGNEFKNESEIKKPPELNSWVLEKDQKLVLFHENGIRTGFFITYEDGSGISYEKKDNEEITIGQEDGKTILKIIEI